MSYIFEFLLEFVKLLGVDQACFVIDVFGDVETAILFVDFADDGFDRRIALDQGTFGTVIRICSLENYDGTGDYRLSHEAYWMS